MTNVLNIKKLRGYTREERAEMTKPKPSSQGVEGYLSAQQVALDYGMNPSSMRKWIRRMGLVFQARKVGCALHIPIPIVEKFIQHSTQHLGITKAPKKPKGWLPMKAAVAEVGCTQKVLSRAIQKKQIAALWHRKSVWCNPEDLKRFKFDFHNKPLPGYVPVRETMRAAAYDRKAFLQWARKHGVTVRKFRNPETHLETLYALKDDIQRYLQWSAGKSRVPASLKPTTLRLGEITDFEGLYRALALKAQSGKASALEQEVLRGLHEYAFSPRDWQKGLV